MNCHKCKTPATWNVRIGNPNAAPVGMCDKCYKKELVKGTVAEANKVTR